MKADEDAEEGNKKRKRPSQTSYDARGVAIGHVTTQESGSLSSEQPHLEDDDDEVDEDDDSFQHFLNVQPRMRFVPSILLNEKDSRQSLPSKFLSMAVKLSTIW